MDCAGIRLRSKSLPEFCRSKDPVPDPAAPPCRWWMRHGFYGLKASAASGHCRLRWKNNSDPDAGSGNRLKSEAGLCIRQSITDRSLRFRPLISFACAWVQRADPRRRGFFGHGGQTVLLHPLGRRIWNGGWEVEPPAPLPASSSAGKGRAGKDTGSWQPQRCFSLWRFQENSVIVAFAWETNSFAR